MKKNWDFPKAFLFDLDGVLIDSEPLHGQAWKETASFFDLFEDLNIGREKLGKVSKLFSFEKISSS